jgi:hypothetical protein
MLDPLKENFDFLLMLQAKNKKDHLHLSKFRRNYSVLFFFFKKKKANGLDLKAISIKLKNRNGTRKTTDNF